jgi:hypothetical protein
MFWWIPVAIVVFALVLLGLVAASLLGRLRRLALVARAAQGKAAEAQVLQASVEGLQRNLNDLAERGADLQVRITSMKTGG